MLKSIFLPFRCNPIGRWDKTWSHWLIPDYEREILSFKARNHTLLGPWMIRFISLSCWNMKLLYYNFKNVLKYANEAENLHFTTRLFIKNVHPCTFSKFYGQNVSQNYPRYQGGNPRPSQKTVHISARKSLSRGYITLLYNNLYNDLNKNKAKDEERNKTWQDVVLWEINQQWGMLSRHYHTV